MVAAALQKAQRVLQARVGGFGVTAEWQPGRVGRWHVPGCPGWGSAGLCIEAGVGLEAWTELARLKPAGKRKEPVISHTHTHARTHTHSHTVKAGRSLGPVSWHEAWSSGCELDAAPRHSQLFQTLFSSPSCVLSFQYSDPPGQLTATTWMLKSSGSATLLPTSVTLHKWPILFGPQSPHPSNGDNNTYLIGLWWRHNDTIHVKCSEQCLAYSEHSTSGRCWYYFIIIERLFLSSHGPSFASQIFLL